MDFDNKSEYEDKMYSLNEWLSRIGYIVMILNVILLIREAITF